MAWTETLNLDGNLSAEAQKAAAQIATLDKGLNAATAALTRANATGDEKAFWNAAQKIEQFKAAIDAVPPALQAEIAAHKAAGEARVAAAAAALAAEKDAAAAAKAAAAQKRADEKAGAENTRIAAVALAQARSQEAKAAEQNAKAAEEAQKKSQEAAKQSAETWGKLGEAAASAGIALAKAAAAGAVALVGLAVAGAALAISAADAKGDLLLLFGTMGEGAYSGEQAVAMLDKLGAELGRTRAELAPTAQAFAAMGVTSVEQIEALVRASESAAVLAKGGAQAFETMFKKIDAAAQTGQALKIPLKGMGSLASMGLKVDDVAQQMGISAQKLGEQLAKGTVDAKKFGTALQDALIKKGAGPLADNALDIERTWGRAKEAVAKMFEDIDTAPFLKGLKENLGVLDSSTASGKAMKAAVQGAFTAIFAAATAALPVIKQVFLALVVGALRAYIAIKQAYNAIAEWAATSQGQAVIEQLGFALKAVAITAVIVVGAIAAIAAVGVLAFAQVAALVIALNMAAGVITAWAITSAKAANDFIQGLVNGIVQGGADVIAAVTGLAASAKQAFRDALGIKSPSAIMMGYGVQMAAGLSHGIESSSGMVAGATQGMAVSGVEALPPAASAAPAAASGGGGGITVNVEPGAIVIQGGSGASASELTETAIAMLFERVALAQGLA